MTALRQAQTAYKLDSGPIRTDRGNEYEAFARITSRLKLTMDKKKSMQALAYALHENRQLWATLAADVAGDGNRLPVTLRAQILNLAEFTRRYSSQVLKGASAEPLIDINTAIMRGLRQQGDKT